jgi:hypothetical protein
VYVKSHIQYLFHQSYDAYDTYNEALEWIHGTRIFQGLHYNGDIIRMCIDHEVYGHGLEREISSHTYMYTCIHMYIFEQWNSRISTILFLATASFSFLAYVCVFMYVYVCACVRIYVYFLCIHTCIRMTYVHTYMHTYGICAYIHAYVWHICIHTCIRMAYMHTYMHTCDICAYIHAYV